MNPKTLRVYYRKNNDTFIAYYRAYCDTSYKEIKDFLEVNSISYFEKRDCPITEKYPIDLTIANYENIIKLGDLLGWELASDKHTKRILSIREYYKYRHYLDFPTISYIRV
jgi:hypothetical protein